MKVVGAFIIALFCIGVLVGAYCAGVAEGWRRGNKRRLAGIGVNRRTAQLYERAVRIVSQLGGYAEGDRFSDDYLSPETRKQVTEWVADYRSEVNNR